MTLNFEQLVLISVIGYLIDIGANFVVAKFLLKTEASMGNVAFFEFAHNLVTFGSGLFLGLSLLSFSSSSAFDESLAFIVVWTIISFFLVRRVFAFNSIAKTLVYLGSDTAMDYGLGGITSVPAGLFLLSTIPTSAPPSNPIAFFFSPLSLRPIILVVGFSLVVLVIAVRKMRHEDVEEGLIAEEN